VGSIRQPLDSLKQAKNNKLEEKRNHVNMVRGISLQISLQNREVFSKSFAQISA